MSDYYVGEIRLFGFPRVPQDWLACDGSLVSIDTYQVLYALIGTTFGGNGSTNFALPDLRGRIPLHVGQNPLGAKFGTETVTLMTSNLPSHGHSLVSTKNNSTTATPGPSVHFGTGVPAANLELYVPISETAAGTLMNGAAVNVAGNSQPHTNMMPTVFANYCICWAGIFPSPPQ